MLCDTQSQLTEQFKCMNGSVELVEIRISDKKTDKKIYVTSRTGILIS